MAAIRRFPRLEHPKIEGAILAKFHGLTIYGSLKTAKREGKNRIWIQVRQSEPKRLRVAESLAYARSVDLQFEED